jgi:hypothetical protein
MSHVTASLVLLLPVFSTAAAQALPAAVAELASRANLTRPVVAWCTGEFRTGQSGDFAVAVSPGADSGRYLILGADATVTELATYTAGAELACYSRGEAEGLSASIEESESVQGGIRPRFDTTVVCGFVTNTEAVCWQYSPPDRGFVRVGGWIT